MTEIVLEVVEATPIKLEVNHDGLSAYEIALKNGFVGTEAEWVESLSRGNIYESDPVFSAWLATNPLSGFLTGYTETDPVFNAWLASNPLAGFLTSETEPAFNAWLASNPFAGFITSESDPVFNAWLAGSPLAGFLTAESDPVFSAWLATNPIPPIVWNNDPSGINYIGSVGIGGVADGGYALSMQLVGSNPGGMVVKNGSGYTRFTHQSSNKGLIYTNESLLIMADYNVTMYANYLLQLKTYYYGNIYMANDADKGLRVHGFDGRVSLTEFTGNPSPVECMFYISTSGKVPITVEGMAGNVIEGLGSVPDGGMVYINNGNGAIINAAGFWFRELGAWVKK